MVKCRPRPTDTIMVVIRWKVFSIPGSLWWNTPRAGKWRKILVASRSVLMTLLLDWAGHARLGYDDNTMISTNFLIKMKLFTITSGIKLQWRRLQITRNSLFYNHFTDQTYIIDVLMEPMFWFVDNFTKTLGPFFVFAVCALTSSVVGIAYWIGLPFWWNKSPYFTIPLVLFGKWLLINVCFHYYMAAYTLPGYPPEGILIPEAASICKKCIAPKPPRTHHCSVCDKCILKMDHHCPWLNNCIGHYNHRYFFLYMVYTCIGVLYLMIFGCELAYNEVWLEPEEELVGHPVRFNNSVMIPVTELMFENANDESESHVNHTLRRRCLIYMAFICSGVFVALGSLAMWHAKLIGRGETSIEANINIAETKRLAAIKKKYVNPYNFGPRQNWRLFLGLVEGRTWWHVVFPSAHKPVGIGLTWQTIHSEQEEELLSVRGSKSQDSFKTFPPVFEKMKIKPKTINND